MAHRTGTIELPGALRSPLEQYVVAVARRDEERREYDLNPHPWSVEAERHRAEIRDRAERSVATAKASLKREAERIADQYERRRRSSFDAVEVESAWRRVRERLDATILIENVLKAGVDRVTIEAIRRNYRAYEQAKAKSTGSKLLKFEQIERMLLDYELPLMDPMEQYATEAEIARRESAEVLTAIDSFEASFRRPKDVMALGFALDRVGMQPPSTESWAAAVQAIDPEARGMAARATLPDSARTALDRNAREGDVRSF